MKKGEDPEKVISLNGNFSASLLSSPCVVIVKVAPAFGVGWDKLRRLAVGLNARRCGVWELQAVAAAKKK